MARTQNYWSKTSFQYTSKQQVGTTFDAILIEMREGYVSVRISGENAKKLFENESGAHQWHRVPPNEARGRTHTSVVKIAVMEIKPEYVKKK